jgi:hypothetical protein
MLSLRRRLVVPAARRRPMATKPAGSRPGDPQTGRPRAALQSAHRCGCQGHSSRPRRCRAIELMGHECLYGAMEAKAVPLKGAPYGQIECQRIQLGTLRGWNHGERDVEGVRRKPTALHGPIPIRRVNPHSRLGQLEHQGIERGHRKSCLLPTSEAAGVPVTRATARSRRSPA